MLDTSASDPLVLLEFVNEYSGLAATTGYLYRLRRARARISRL